MSVDWLPAKEPCITPLGKAMAWGLDNSGPTQEWVCVIDATGENFNLLPQDIRFAPCASDRRPEVSPFGRASPRMQAHIERYKQNGWL